MQQLTMTGPPPPPMPVLLPHGLTPAQVAALEETLLSADAGTHDQALQLILTLYPTGTAWITAAVAKVRGKRNLRRSWKTMMSVLPTLLAREGHPSSAEPSAAHVAAWARLRCRLTKLSLSEASALTVDYPLCGHLILTCSTEARYEAGELVEAILRLQARGAIGDEDNPYACASRLCELRIRAGTSTAERVAACRCLDDHAHGFDGQRIRSGVRWLTAQLRKQAPSAAEEA